MNQFAPSASDRIQVYYSPPALPAVCAICNNAPDGRRKYIDVGHQIDYYGAVYFCSDCIVPLCHALEYVELERYEALEKKHERLLEENYVVCEELEDAKRALNSLYRVRPDLDTDNSSGMEDFLLDIPESESALAESDESERSIDESITGGGSTNIPPTTGLNL